MTGSGAKSAHASLRTALGAVVVLLAGACGRDAPPAVSEPVSPPATTAPGTSAAPPPFGNRVWLRADPGSAPGAMVAFLSDGTLIADSCFETYRLSSWRFDGGELAWNEDGIEIRARIASVDADSLVLRVALEDGEVEQRFASATVPYVCPDMPR